MDGTNRIDELEQKFIENPRRYFAPLANEYRKAGNPQQAIAICRAHLAQLPGHMSGQIVYGQALFEGGEYDQAQTVFENALAMDRENLVALRHLGDLALRKGETAAARQWYSKILEIDPRDATVLALVGEIDAAAEAQSSTTDAEPASTTIPEAVQPMPEPPVPDESRVDEEDSLIAEELGYPVPPAHAFVTETMAELYLAQGFRDRALSVYRQLVEMRPGEERLRARLAELEQPGGMTEAAPTTASAAPIAEAPGADPVESAQDSGEPLGAQSTQSAVEDPAASAPVESRRDEEPSVESPEIPERDDRSPSIETPTPSPEIQAPSEESDAGQTPSIDSPPSETREAEPESVETVISDEPRAEPEGVAEVDHAAMEETPVHTGEFAHEPLRSDAPRVPTVREFFANLGRRKPAKSNGSSSNGAGRSRTDWSSYGDPSSESDAKAAAALAGAFGGAPAAPSFTPEALASPVTGKESEEDVARFRAWLDGLTT